ncbi:MAG: virulence protein RhuM/Fic/DOC family protein [Bacteriovoracaceae bacterium]|jgi:prophage maintenance system killer protein|nr:virulence protein RhuM/Fic/DOC family protein [Bacteriovoracaceae bacterium]
MNKQIIIFQTVDGKVSIDVQVENETVWLSLTQMAELFERDRSVISRHLNKIFKENELNKESTVANFATVQLEGNREVTRNIEFYNLDAIISVGYRVNSKRGTQFRQWASQKLKDYLINGYSLNQKKMTKERVDEIQRTLHLFTNTLQSQALVNEKGVEVLSLILSYAKTWHLLFQYDENDLELPKNCTPSKTILNYTDSIIAIDTLKRQLVACGEATPLFGQQSGNQLAGILGNIEQTFAGEALYASSEEKAAHLLYFIIKDHPFSDGNKRIGTLLFLYYLRKQGVSLTSLSNTSLVALALLIAESDPIDKNTMIRLIVNLLTMQKISPLNMMTDKKIENN